MHQTPPRRWAAMAAVLALHVLLWLALQAVWQPRGTVAPPSSRITLSLPPLVQPRQPSPQPVAAPARLRAATANKAAAPVAAPTAVPAAVDGELPTAVALPLPAERSTLTLRLPSLAASAPRNPALSDPRANTARLTLEGKLALALDNTVHQQVQADGTTIRRRVGNQCVDLHESRAVQLMPETDFLRFAPRAASPSYDCK